MLPEIFVLSLGLILATLLLWGFFPSTGAGTPDLKAGLLALWDPGVILFFESLWGAAFLHTGRSRVTGATVRLHVVEGKI